MAAPTQQLTGLMSGMDTQSIVEQLMAIAKQPYEKLDVKKKTEQLRLQAFQAVNSMLLKFRSSVSSLSSQKLWNSKTATSSNESSLTATASQYAVNGTYSFRVTQMATQTQYWSKGFSNTKETFGTADANGVYDTLGTINLANAKTRVDTSAKLESLNGGTGVYRGSIRITDSRGNSGDVDLSGCETLNDVVNAINNASGARVTASIGRNDAGDNFLQLKDNADGAGAMKVQNVGQGTTAKDLGLTVDYTTDANGAQVINGNDIYYMGRDSYLSELNDGLGIEDGKISIYMSDGGAGVGSFSVDLNGAKTVGDVLDRVNKAIGESGNPAFDGLAFGLNDAKNGFQFTGAKKDATYIVYNSWELTNEYFNPEVAQQLGIGGSFIVDDSGIIAGERVLGDVDSPMLKNLAGANGTGVGAAGSEGQPRVPVQGGLTDSTLVEYLNNGKGLDIGAGIIINFAEGNGLTSNRTTDNIINQAELKALMNQSGTTIRDVLDYIEDRIATVADEQNIQGLKGITLEVKDGGVVINGASAAHGFEITGDLAISLGINRDSSSFNGTGAISDDWQAALDDLWSVTDIRVGNQDLNDTTKLIDLKGVTGRDWNGSIATLPNPSDPYWGDPENISPDYDANPALGFDNFLTGAGDLKVTIGGTEYDLQSVVDNLRTDHGDDMTIGDLINGINDYFANDAVPPVDNPPYIYYNWVNTGFQWRNVDLGQSFEASGAFAELFGLDKSYDPTGIDTTAAIQDTVQKNLNPTMPGYATSLYPLTDTNINTITIGQCNGGRGLSLAGDMSDTIDLVFTDKDDSSLSHTISVSKQEIFDRLALAGVSDPQNATISQYYESINELFADKIAQAKTDGDLAADANFKLGCNEGGLTILNAYGNQAGDRVELKGNLVMNGTWAIGNGAVLSEEPDTEFGHQISYLNPAEFHNQTVTGIGDLVIKVGNTEHTLSTDGLGADSTLRDVINKLNSELASKGVSGINFTTNSDGTGLMIENDTNSEVTVVNTQDANTLARDLGLLGLGGADRTIASRSVANGSPIGRSIMGRATTLASLAGSKTLELTSITLTNTRGTTQNVDITNCKTVGDFVDAINMFTNLGIRARINDQGDGLFLEEYWAPGSEPTAEERVGNIKLADYGSGNAADILGIAGTGGGYVDGLDYSQQKSSLSGSLNKSITITGADTLESVMHKLSNLGYKTAIVNDGSGANPYRLTVSSAATGEAADFILSSNLEFLGLSQTSRGKDAKILYGNPSSGVSPIMLSSSTNTNSTAILGLTLEIKGASDTYTTITVDTDKSGVVDAIKEMAQTYNDLNDLVSYLDGYDPETGEKGPLFGDTGLRNLMKSIDDMFFEVYNPEGWSYGEKSEKTSWTWMDLGISFSTNQTNAATGKTGSTWYSTMDLDLDVLEEMVASNWDKLTEALASQTNVANSKAKGNAAASASFNYQYDVDPVTGLPIIPGDQSDPKNAINNDHTTTMANGNGFTANKTIAQGENQYTVYLQEAVTLSRLSIYHADANTFIPGYGTGNGALKDFLVEYLDATTGKWETLRNVPGNTSNATHLGVASPPPTVQAIRITASSTNAADGKFRLLDVQIYADTGLAGRLNSVTTALGDVTTGFMATQTTDIEAKIADIDEQMARMQERLDSKEASLWRQFTAMETALSKLEYQKNQLNSMLGSLLSGGQ